MLREWISPFFSNPCRSCRSRSHFVFVSFSWAYFSRIFSKVVFFLLILSYLAIKLVPFGRVTCFGNVLLLKTIFCLIFFVYVLIFSLIYVLYRKSFQKWDELFLLKLELLLIQVVSQVLLYLFVFFFSPIYQTPFFIYCFPLVILRNRHHFDEEHMFCVSKWVRSLLKCINIQTGNRPILSPLIFLLQQI